MQAGCELTISFAADGNSLAFLGGGWARSEPQFTWTIGAESHLLLPQVKLDGDYILTLDVIPFVHPPELASQRLIVSINDAVVGSANLHRSSLLGYKLHAGLLPQAERVLVTLQHPDAACPHEFLDSEDERELAFAVREAKLYRLTEPPISRRLPAGLTLGSAGLPQKRAGETMDLTSWAAARSGLSIPDLAMAFESLGENCEFGLFQRRCDAEPLGLLRFSSIFIRNLIYGLESGFHGLGDIDDIEPRPEGDEPREYMVHEKKYGLVYHTFVYERERSVWLMREQEAARLKFLRRKLLEEIEVADKIFVYRFAGAISQEEILPLYMALNRNGPLTLLWVVPEERDRPAGTIEVLLPNLLKGYIDRFAPDDNAHDLSFNGWLQLCANAWVMRELTVRLSLCVGTELRATDQPC